MTTPLASDLASHRRIRSGVTYKEATAIIDGLMGGIEPEGARQDALQYVLAARAEQNQAEAIELAWAFATVWRHDMHKPDFIDPPFGLLALVEHLIAEPVEQVAWGARVAGD